MSVSNRLDDTAKVWRFMDLWKFISLLNDNALTMARIDILEDPYDGQLNPQWHDDAKRRISERLESDEEQQKIMDRFDSFLRQGGTDSCGPAYVSCWYTGQSSSLAMWKLYCPSGQGVALQSTVGLLKTIQSEELTLQCGPVEYRTLNRLGDINDWEKLPFLKRKAYDFEREYRIIGREPWQKSLNKKARDTHKQLKIDPSKLLTKIWAPAGCPTWQMHQLRGLVRQYDIEVVVSRSGIMDDSWGTRG